MIKSYFIDLVNVQNVLLQQKQQQLLLSSAKPAATSILLIIQILVDCILCQMEYNRNVWNTKYTIKAKAATATR